MARSKYALAPEHGIQRYATRRNRLRALKTQKRARLNHTVKKKKQGIKKTPAQRQAEAVARKTRVKAQKDAILAVTELVWEKAQELSVEFGNHTPEWFYQTIMQHSKSNKTPRDINRWNAFVSMEFEALNGGK